MESVQAPWAMTKSRSFSFSLRAPAVPTRMTSRLGTSRIVKAVKALEG